MELLQTVYAQTAQQSVSSTLSSPLPAELDSLPEIFSMVINLIIGIGWALVFVMLALGFIQYVTSKGEVKATDAARQWLTFAVVGGVGLFFISILRTIIPNLLGAQGSAPGGSAVFQ